MTVRGTRAAPVWVRLIAGVVRFADAICRWSGYIVAFATLGTVVTCFATVYLRYVMDLGYMWLTELYIWQHVAVIVLGAGYAMMSGGFVRVDVFYSRWNDRRRAIVDMAMTVLLLAPFLWVFGDASWKFWSVSFAADEGSMNPDGLKDWWLLKATILGFVALVALQGLAFFLRGVLVLSGRREYALGFAGLPAQPIT